MCLLSVRKVLKFGLHCTVHCALCSLHFNITEQNRTDYGTVKTVSKIQGESSPSLLINIIDSITISYYCTTAVRIIQAFFMLEIEIKEKLILSLTK